MCASSNILHLNTKCIQMESPLILHPSNTQHELDNQMDPQKARKTMGDRTQQKKLTRNKAIKNQSQM